MRRTFKFRVYKHRRNAYLHNMISTSGRIWNYCVAFQRTFFKLFGKYCSKNKLQKHIAKIRNRREDWQLVYAQSVQCIITRLDNSYKRFFRWVKTRKGPKVGRPSFKKSSEYSSFTLTQTGWKLLGGNRIRIGHHNFKFVNHRKIEGTIKQVTVKRDRVGRLWLFFSTLDETFKPASPLTGSAGGFDFGLKNFLTSDDGSVVKSPEFLKGALTSLKRANRELSKKKRGSNNRQRAKLRLAKINEKVANQRRDWFFKLAHKLCDRHELLCFEDLNLEAMKRRWGRKVSDLALHSFLLILNHVATKRGCRVIQIGRFEPTTKTCSRCGHVQKMPLDVRTFECGGCRHSIGRDVNAAINIKRLGRQAVGPGNVSQACPAISA